MFENGWLSSCLNFFKATVIWSFISRIATFFFFFGYIISLRCFSRWMAPSVTNWNLTLKISSQHHILSLRCLCLWVVLSFLFFFGFFFWGRGRIVDHKENFYVGTKNHSSPHNSIINTVQFDPHILLKQKHTKNHEVFMAPSHALVRSKFSTFASRCGD